MLYEMVALPCRCFYPSDTSTRIFRFLPHDVEESSPLIDGYSVSMHEDASKYKTVELYDGMVVERLMLSPNPVELHKPWWTSDDEVVVMQSKYFCKDRVYVLRNVEALQYLNQTELMFKDVDDGIPHNMYMHKIGNVVNRDISSRLQYIVPDNDIELYACDISNMSYYDLKEMCGGVGIIPDDLILPYSDVYTKLKNIGRSVKYPEVNAGMYQMHVDEIDHEYDDVEDACTSTNYSWLLLELLYKLNNSRYTDIRIVYDMRDMHIPLSYCESAYNRKAKPDRDIVLERLFKKWIVDRIKSGKSTATSAALHKTWTEEVFISLENDDGFEDYYYFDLMHVIAGSIAL
jgi:hypothetical protein